ncbi:hypothetical protein LAWI1_G006937, partial [Lachnellula willkommii]
MDPPAPPTIVSPITPRLSPGAHTPSRPSSRLCTRERPTDDILTDLTPSTTFEAFTSPSGKLRASIEAASQSEQAFGIRATLASKKIQEWVNELSSWPWPTESGSAGFEMPAPKRRKISDEPNTNGSPEVEYRGSLPTADALQYEVRIEEITGDMEDLNFEEIKRQVLDTHFSAKSRPSSSASSAPMPSFLSSYTKMDDFTAIVTATVLQALPNLSRLMRLMEVWSIRLAVLRKVPPLLTALDDVEVALKSGWSAMQVPENQDSGDVQALSRNTFDVMKSVLQDKVTSLGQDLDYMLDTLEGRPDTLPDSWLDRMESIEQDYGEWAVAGDRKVREGEWARMAKARKEAEDARRAKEAEEAEAARLKAEKDAEVARILAEEQAAEAAKRKAEEDATNARILAEKQAAEASKLKAEKDAEVARIQAEEQAAEAARRKAAQDAEEERIKAEQLAEELRLKTERDAASARILAQEQATESAKRKADEEAANARRLQEEQIADAARRKAEQDVENERLKAEELAEQVRLKTERDAEEARRLKAKEAAELVRQQAVKDAADAKRLEEEQALEAIRRKEESDAEDAERLKAEAAAKLAQQQARRETEEATRTFEEAQALEAAQLQAELNAQNAEVARRQAIEDAENGEAAERDAKAEQDLQNEDSVNAAAAKKQPTHIALPEIVQRDEEPVAIRTPPVSITGAASTVNPSIDTDSEANESIYSPDFDLQLERFAPFDGSSDIHLVDLDVPITQNRVLQPGQNGNAIPQPKGNKSSRPASISIPPANNLGNILQTSRTSTPLSNDAVQMPSTAPADNRIMQDRNSPSTPKSKLQLGHAFAEFIRHSLPSTPAEESSKRSLDFLKSSAISVPDSVCMNADHTPTPPANVFSGEPTAAEETHQLLVIKSDETVTHSPDSLLADAPTEHRQDIESADHILASTETGDSELFEIDDSQLSIQRSRNSSVSGYSISQATPEILEAEPAEYFRPVLSPIESPRFSIQGSEPATPTISRTFVSDAGNHSFSTLDEDEEMSSSTPQRRAEEAFPPQESTTLPSESEERDAEEVEFGNNLEDSLEISQIGDSSTPLVARRASLSPIDTGIKIILPARPHSSSSETLTIVTGFEGNASTPMIPSSPLSAERESFSEVEPESPSAGRVGIRNIISHDYSPPGSPALMPAIRKRGSLPSPTSPTLSALDQSDTSSLSIDAPTFSTSDPSDTSSISTDAPIFDNVQVSPDRSMNSGPTMTSNDQLEQQISSILDSIPTKIRLTSKPDAHQANTLRIKKTRRSVTPSLRSTSSMSNYSRAPTPSFLLSPDQSQTRSRPRPQNGTPETKLYHLSRSNGEAPIKLLVRLVGENGERVMVRVGGGWADLGEYLKEYASHHGRRNASNFGNDKIEIQDLPSSRNVSGASTVRGNGNGRSTPVPESRP